jgi:hypothetical protein
MRNRTLPGFPIDLREEGSALHVIRDAGSFKSMGVSFLRYTGSPQCNRFLLAGKRHGIKLV